MKKVLKIIKRSMLIFFSIIIVLILVVFFYTKLPKFGALPKGNRLTKIEQSPQFKDGVFKNIVEKPDLAEGYTMLSEARKFLFEKFPRQNPIDRIPSFKQNLKEIPLDSNVLIWFGHSSVYFQLNGKRFLVDPVFSGSASPMPGSVKSYNGTDVYTADDMPFIDYLLISHDHYDHVDYETLLNLKDKISHVVCGLGVGAHFERWGYNETQIIEKDWYEKLEIGNDFYIYTESSHHFSGRGFTRGKALWLSFFIQSPSLNVYISGDGGFDDRFREIGKKFQKIDWAIMECGQYNLAWESVHNLPEQVVLASRLLKAKNVIPVHHSKFTLARHPWDEPLVKITALSENQDYRLVTPMIGQTVELNNSNQLFERWWEGIQ